MKRKLVRHGNTSLTVSLPKKWTDTFHLQKGDEIELTPHEDQIILQARAGKKPAKKGTLDISQLGSLTRRAFDAMYKSGYDEVEVLYTNHRQLGDVEQAIALEAMTFEIVKQEKNRCVVKDISEAETKEFDALLRRTVLLLKVMGEDLLVALKERDFETILLIRDLEKTNNKFTHFCRRALAINGYPDRGKTVFLYTIVEQLETCADEFKFLCDYLVQHQKLKISKEVLDLFQQVNATIALFTELFLKHDIENAKKLNDLRKKTITSAFSLFEATKDQQKIIIHYLINIESMVFGMLGPYLATVL
ncbi:MAG: AbrB/MazE/SpoVT family DNA-binding domain-containing protein [Candidatus Woesearchaeota archaeon]|nr:AbrB/MazE/SpoVT family DNA-binding domain-containing protein [Candidatus Woesearchaeota archaeon]